MRVLLAVFLLHFKHNGKVHEERSTIAGMPQHKPKICCGCVVNTYFEHQFCAEKINLTLNGFC